MNGRERFYISYFSIYLILSCPVAHAADGRGAVVSAVKSVSSWAISNIGKVAGIIVAGAASSQYSSNNFDVDTGTFGLPNKTANVSRTITESRGIPVGVQSSSTYNEPSGKTMTSKEMVNHQVNITKERAKSMSIRDLEKELVDRSVTYQKAQQSKDNGTYNQMNEAEINVLQQERNSRKQKSTFIKTMSNEDLNKYQAELEYKLELAEADFKEANAPDWFGHRQPATVQKNQVDTIIGMIERVKAERNNRRVIHTVSTAMVLTSQTAGTDNKTKTEKAPEGGNGNGGGSNQDPDQDPKKKGPADAIAQGAGMAAGGEAAKEVAKSVSKPATPAKPAKEAMPAKAAPEAKGHAEFKANEAKQFEANQKAMKEARKAEKTERAKMNNDRQPFHEKGIEAKFPDNPGQKDHMFRDEAGHIAARTPNAETQVIKTIDAQHFTGVDKHGNSHYLRIHEDGNQIWAQVRPDGTIKNCGANVKHWPKNPNTGFYERPAGPKEQGPGVAYTIGAGIVGGLAASESRASDLGPSITDRIKSDPSPFTLPPAPADHKPISFTKSPEMQAIVNKRVERLRSMSPQDQLKEVMKPTSTPGINIPGLTMPNHTPSTTSLPKLTLPSSTAKSSGTGQTALPVLTSTRTPLTSSAPKPTFSNPKPTSLPSAPRIGSTTYSVPRSSAPVSRPSAPPSGYGSKGGAPPTSFGGSYKRS